MLDPLDVNTVCEMTRESMSPIAYTMIDELGPEDAVNLMLSLLVKMLKACPVDHRAKIIAAILTNFNHDGTEIF